MINPGIPPLHPSALTIAGSDPSGGAGIQMDLKTFAKTGVFGMAVITALTAQNAMRVSHAWPMETAMVRDQMVTLLEDMTPGAIKTGMLPTREIIMAVMDTLPDQTPLVVDPVLISTSGHRLIAADAMDTIRESLIARATLVTPNIPEAEVLTRMKIQGEEEMIQAGRMILDLGAAAVMMKGGHGTGEDAVDILITHSSVEQYSAPRMPYQVHGSGCCFSAAVAGYLAQGMHMEMACQRAKVLVTQAIRDAIPGISGMRMVNPR